MDVVFESTLPVTVKTTAPASSTSRAGSASRRVDLAVFIALTRSSAGSVDITVRLTDPLDPYFLYTLNLSDDDFSNLRRSQDIKVDFASFPNNLVQLLEKCTSHEDSRYLLELETAEILGAAGAALAALNVVEVNDFKNLVHLSLRFVPGNDASIKKHLAACLTALKGENEALRNEMEHSTADLSKRLAQAQLEAQTGVEGCRKAETELSTVAERLKAEHAAALASLKEAHMNLQTERQERLARDQTAKEARDGAKLLALENRLEQLTQRLSETDSLNSSLEANVRELAAKLRSSETLNSSMESELGSSRAENMELRKTKHEQECVLNENRVRMAELAQELKGKAEAALKQADLTSAANDHRAQLEKSMHGNEAQRLELQRIIATSGAEIQKGNGIIVRLQKEIAALHAKLDGRSGVIIRQEQAIASKDKEIARGERQLVENSTALAHKTEALAQANGRSTQLAAKLEDTSRQLKNSEGIISWLNKQLNDGAGPVRRFTVEKYMTTGVAGIAADVVKPTRAPFGTKTASELNKRQVHYKSKAASGGAMSPGSSSRNPSPAVFEQYLPKQISPVDLDSQKEDVRSKIPQPARGQNTSSPPTREARDSRESSIHSTASLIRNATALMGT